ncbi:hypothetical protein PQ478_09085 [Alkalihalophilus pseudofirmus]|uniref:hypothetical protein n=1 Tax=Alkalihalophilus pseudofirmus TaxID=79885 RepID=UPI00259B26FF|nr:hypothetical protein [Alkalihalophilus pseudofirmus]WEG18625.1 hypothetical protein PQ478_09085 [Alkalihalophilus pseudofirmus]
MTYERIGLDYVGTSVDSIGDIISSHHLKREAFGNAFAGRTIKLKMKDGSIERIKDYWFDCGSYESHGEFISIGAGRIEELQNCYVYSGYNINKATFERMLNDYLSRERIYDYREIEEWCNLQHKWYEVVVNNKKIPYMMNKYGEMVEKWTKKKVFARENRIKSFGGKLKEFTYFKFKYKDEDRLIKIEANYLDVLKATLPYSEEEIIKNCKLPLRNT